MIFFFFTKGKTLGVTALRSGDFFFKPVIRVQNVFITYYLLVSAFTSKKTEKPNHTFSKLLLRSLILSMVSVLFLQ